MKELELEKLRLRATKIQRCKTDLYYLAEMIGYKDIAIQPHKELCHFIEAPRERGRTLLLLPRGSFKTSVAVIAQIIQDIIKNPNIRILLATETLSLAIKILKEIKERMTSPEFIELFGDLRQYDSKTVVNWRESEITVKRETMAKEPTVSCMGIDVVKVGFHYDKIYIDDCVSQRNTTNSEQITQTLEWYRLLLSLPDPGGTIQITGTRYDFSDLYGTIMDTEMKDAFDVYMRAAILDDGSLYFPSRLTKQYLDDQKNEQGNFIFSCNTEEAPILMGDWSHKPIKEVKIGDIIIGFANINGVERKRLIKSKVLHAHSKEAEVVKITMESGRIIRCTPDHKWYTGRIDSSHKEYSPAHIKGKLMFVLDPFIPELSDEEKKAAYWLGGIFDGEGSCDKNGSIWIHQSPQHNPEVHKKIGEALDLLKFSYGETNTRAKDGSRYITGGRSEKVRFIMQTDCVRKFKIINSLFHRGGCFIEKKDRVIKIEPDGKDMVYSLQTETGNYIAWGYASKNCQYLLSPLADGDQTFKPVDICHYEEASLAEWNNQDGKICFDRGRYNTYVCVDPAISQTDTADSTGIVVVSIDMMANWYVREAYGKKMQPSEIVQELSRLKKKYNYTKAGIEMVSFAQALKFFVAQEEKETKEVLRVEELKTNAKSKELRIRGLQPYFNQKRIFIKKDMVDLQYQLLHFPRTQHDDILDALAYVPQLLEKPMPKKAPIHTPRNQLTGRPK